MIFIIIYLNILSAIALINFIDDKLKYSLLNNGNFTVYFNKKYYFLLLVPIFLIPKWPYILVIIMTALFIINIEKKQRTEQQVSQSYYKIYKYVQIQLETGLNADVILKSLYRVVDYTKLKNQLIQFSATLSQSHDTALAIRYLKSSLTHQESELFISILENMIANGGKQETFSRLNNLLFQKYLSGIRENTKKIKRFYLYTVIMFTMMITIMLLLPIIDQMLISAKIIFR